MKQPSLISNQVLEIGTRLKVAPSELLVNAVFARELNHQAHLFDMMGLVDIAHTLAAIESEIIPIQQGQTLLAALLTLQNKPEDFISAAMLGDLYTNREAWLAKQTQASDWLGAGRARREATTSAFVLTMRLLVLELMDVVMAFIRILIEQSDHHKQAVMPDYTYLQAAQPTTFGHYLLGFAYPLLRDLERFELLLRHLDSSPMGCGSTNGSRLTQNRLQLAELLGFSTLVSHARDAMWQADVFIDCTSILTNCSITLSRLAEDLQVFSTQEFALVELNDQHARASKIMPQKKNPFALTHIRGVANKMLGVMTSVTAVSRTPSGQPDNRLLIYGELPEALQMVKEACALMREVLQNLHFNTARGKALIDSGWVLATDLAEMLVLEGGLDFRSAHHVVATLASEYQGKSILALDLETLLQVGESLLGQRISLTAEQLKAALDVQQGLEARTEPGGTATRCMDDMIAECKQLLSGFTSRTDALKIQFAKKQQDLLLRALEKVHA